MSFELDAYLSRIGVPRPAADLAGLQEIVTGHTRSIAFENLSPFTGRDVLLDDDALTAKLVRGGRGGFCFEQNLVLRLALEALGHDVTPLIARVVWGRPADAPPTPRTHLLLRVQLAGGPHVVDVGFGGQTPTGVLALQPDVEQATPHEPFRLHSEPDGMLAMQSLVGGTWRSLYRFDLVPAPRCDLEMGSWFSARHPGSHFVTGLGVALAAEGRRRNLNGRTLTTHHLGGPSETRELAGPTEIMTQLRETFRLDLSGLPDLERALKALF